MSNPRAWVSDDGYRWLYAEGEILFQTPSRKTWNHLTHCLPTFLVGMGMGMKRDKQVYPGFIEIEPGEADAVYAEFVADARASTDPWKRPLVARGDKNVQGGKMSNETERRPLHSLGPWRIDRWQGGIELQADDGTLIYVVNFDGESVPAEKQAEMRANALLMVAAPDMLKALERARDAIDWDEIDTYDPEKNRTGYLIRHAIHRATHPGA